MLILPFLVSIALTFSFSHGSEIKESGTASCLRKLQNLKTILVDLKFHEKTMEVQNLKYFYGMCLDATNCLETIDLPEFAKSIMKFGAIFLKSACDDLGQRIEPLMKCIKEQKLNANSEETLQDLVAKNCKNVVSEDLEKNENRIS